MNSWPQFLSTKYLNLKHLKFWLVTVSLLLLMAVTRSHHFATAIHLPDASLAVFFMAGRYLRYWLGLVVFFGVVFAIDFYVIHYRGVSDYCFTMSYAFLFFAYGVLWLGGRMTCDAKFGNFAGFSKLVTVIVLAIAVAFFISNTSFYWLSGRILEPSFSHYVQRFLYYLPQYMASPWLWFVGFAMLEYCSEQYVAIRNTHLQHK